MRREPTVCPMCLVYNAMNEMILCQLLCDTKMMTCTLHNQCVIYTQIEIVVRRVEDIFNFSNGCPGIFVATFAISLVSIRRIFVFNII